MQIENKWIDLLKWFISSVCIVVVTLIIDSGFKDREAGIKEMEVYDKYVHIILQADNIEQRWKLCEYFSIVTPTERLRNRWQAYKDTISQDYFNWKSSQFSKNDSLQIISDLNDKPLVTTDEVKISAHSYEISGFNDLINKNLNSSIDNFEQANRIKPGLHNCWEIYQYLKSNKTSLLDNDSEKWNELYKKILKDWSWGLPNNIKFELQNVTD